MDREVLRLVLAPIACTIASELCFTVYVNVYGMANQVGHYLKIISFYLIYRASVAASLQRPYEVLSASLEFASSICAPAKAASRPSWATPPP